MMTDDMRWCRVAYMRVAYVILFSYDHWYCEWTKIIIIRDDPYDNK